MGGVQLPVRGGMPGPGSAVAAQDSMQLLQRSARAAVRTVLSLSALSQCQPRAVSAVTVSVVTVVLSALSQCFARCGCCHCASLCHATLMRPPVPHSLWFHSLSRGRAQPVAYARGHARAELWARGRFDEAFSAALEAGGGVLDWLLHKAPPESVLEADPCVLSPGVLLSLLTHLAHGVSGTPPLPLHLARRG